MSGKLCPVAMIKCNEKQLRSLGAHLVHTSGTLSVTAGTSQQQGLEAGHMYPRARAEGMDVCVLSGQLAFSALS